MRNGAPRPTSVSGQTQEDLLRLLRDGWLKEHDALITEARQDPGARRRLKDLVACTLAREGVALDRQGRETVVEQLVDELAGLGPLEPLLRDERVTEIMVNGPERIYLERDGVVERAPVRFRSAGQLEDVIQRIVAPVGRRIDPSLPFVDARLPDGSRIHAIIPPLAIGGPFLTVRKFQRRFLSPDELVDTGTCSREMMAFLGLAVRARCNLVISGGTGSGKTTTLNALSSFIDPRERVVTIEDAAELMLQREHVVSLEARPANMEGRGEVTIRMLLRNALRMRPDRIVIGEVRGREALDLLQAMNTGHEGSLTTVHANSPEDALRRLATMALMAAEDLPHQAVVEQLGATVELVVQQSRLANGMRRITAVAAVETRGNRLAVRGLFAYRTGQGLAEGGFVRSTAPLPPRLREKLGPFLPVPAASEVGEP